MELQCTGKNGCYEWKEETNFATCNGERINVCKACYCLKNKRQRKVSAVDPDSRPLHERSSFDYGRLPEMWKKKLPLAIANLKKINLDKHDRFKKE